MLTDVERRVVDRAEAIALLERNSAYMHDPVNYWEVECVFHSLNTHTPIHLYILYINIVV